MNLKVQLPSNNTRTRGHRKLQFSAWAPYITIVLGCLQCLLIWNNCFTAAIRCFECDSSNNFTCTEKWDPSEPIVQRYLTYCGHIFEARYCVKMTGIYEGKLGTKRFCSSRDWGNYCEYIKRPGDIQEYRSCIFSCSLSGCNTATETVTMSRWTICSFTLISVLIKSIWNV